MPNGRGGKIRTCDPLFPKQVRYQAALRPDKGLGFITNWNQKASPLFSLGAKKFMLDKITGHNA